MREQDPLDVAGVNGIHSVAQSLAGIMNVLSGLSSDGCTIVMGI